MPLSKDTNTKNKNSIKTQPVSTKRKLSLISAILIVIGSSIGAGIFLKNDDVLKNTQGNIYLALVAWAIAIFAIVCLGLCLIELCSASDTNKLGIIGWIKTFCNEYLYQAGKKFMAYLYLPINFFIMPYYAVMTMQQAFPDSAFAHLDWWAVALIAFAITSWFIWTSGLSTRMTNIQNWIITSVKFFPLAFAMIIGYVYVGVEGHINDPTIQTSNPTPTFSELSPVIGLFLSIPAIFFVFDGFYSTAGLQTEMREPKKTSVAMLIGLCAVSVIDILISISLMISGQGSLSGLRVFFDQHHCGWILQIFQMLIAFGIFGIINGFCLYSSNYYEELISKKDVVLSKKIVGKMKPESHLVGCTYAYSLFVIIFVIATMIGSFGYIDTIGYGNEQANFATRVCSLFSFVDLMANWTSVLAFACIVVGVIGALINRKTKKIKTVNDKNFKWASWVTIVIVGVSLLLIVIQTFTDLGLVSYYYAHGMYEEDGINHLISAIMTVVTLIAFCAVMFIPTKIFMPRKGAKNVNKIN